MSHERKRIEEIHSRVPKISSLQTHDDVVWLLGTLHEKNEEIKALKRELSRHDGEDSTFTLPSVNLETIDWKDVEGDARRAEDRFPPKDPNNE